MQNLTDMHGEKRDEYAECLNAIMIVRHTITSIARKVSNFVITYPTLYQYLDSLDPFHVEPFFQGELLVNITKHEMVPQHSVLAENEKDDLLKKYRCKEGQLPKV